MSSFDPFIDSLARAFAAGEQSLSAIIGRGERALGGPRRWLPALAEEYLATFPAGTGVRPRHREVVRLILDFAPPRYTRQGKRARNFRVREPIAEAPRMQPIAAAESWNLPAIETTGALAEWLGVTTAELAWFADLKGLGARQETPRLHHYHYRIVEKRTGGLRLIEAPGARLKVLQRRILSEILDRVPTHYDAAHGFVKGRSVRTFAAPHVRQRVLLRLDLQDFFPCISGARVQAVFRTLGYPESVADLLGGICTNATPRSVWHRAMSAPWASPAGAAALSSSAPLPERTALRDTIARYARPHLPQGAPTSPALANLCAYRLDCRLTGLADWAGAVYTRYADDLAFSGGREFARDVEQYGLQIAAIVLDEGWSVQHRKTRVMRPSARQHLAGLVVNEGINIGRTEYDTLKATLTNCVRRGAASQNHEGRPDFRAHLEGRVAWVSSINVAKGARLREILQRIVWD